MVRTRSARSVQSEEEQNREASDTVTETGPTSAELVEEIVREAPRPPSPAKTRKSSCKSYRRRELLKAKIELAKLKIAYLEESDIGEDGDSDCASEKLERTEQWVNVQNDSLRKTDQIVTSTPAGATQANGNQSADSNKVAADVRNDHASAADRQKPSSSQPRQNSENAIAETKPSAINIKELAAAISQAAQAMQPASTVHRFNYDIPAFSGAVNEWLPFKTAYEETAKNLSEQENLIRLRRCLKGAAKEAVHCLFIGATTTDEVMTLLKNRFGRPDTLVLSEIEKLRRLPR